MVLLLPIAAIILLAFTGHARSFIPSFSAPPTDVIAILIWTVAVLPLFLAAWELGREHKRGRLLGYELIVGFRDLWNVAIGRGLTESVPLDYRVPAADKVGVAIALGMLPAVILPLFFLSALPDLRTAGGIFWLVVEGVAMGLTTYFYRRAVAYLIDEPGRWDLVRNFRMLNPARYEARGRVFVRWQVAFMIFGALWWLVVGPMVLFQ